jgi:zinc protease
VVGAIDQEEVTTSLKTLKNKWQKMEVSPIQVSDPEAFEETAVYFYDIPNAKQSMIYLGYPALAETDADHYPAYVMNYILGGGGFASRLTQELRVEKGYTYRISSEFSGSGHKGPFRISTSVQSKITLEAAQSIQRIVEEYGSTFSEADLATTKGFLIKSNARSFESARAKLNFLDKIGRYSWSPDFKREQEAIVKAMNIEKIEALAETYLDLDQMVWLVVGDANSQMTRIKELGVGKPVLLNSVN